MPFEIINFAAAQAILRNQNVDPGTATRSSLAAGLLPGVVGLALPLIIARNNQQPRAAENGGGMSKLTKVPDVTAAENFEAARELLSDAGLAARRELAFDPDHPKGTVVAQDPEAGSYAPLQSEVKVVVSNGPRPLPDDDVGNLIVARVAEAVVRQLREDGGDVLEGMKHRRDERVATRQQRPEPHT
jgi:hypothetical protein